MEDDDYDFVDGPDGGAGGGEGFSNPLFRSSSGAPAGASVFQTNPVWSPGARGQPGMPADSEAAVPRGEAVEAEQQEAFAQAWQAAAAGDDAEAADAVVPSFVSSLEGRAAELREQAAAQQQRGGARALRLQDLAADLEAESATWRLLYTLHGVREASFPAGAGGPTVAGAGRALTLRQRAAALLEGDASLNQLARVVCWLEELAGRALDAEEAAAARAGGAGAAFSRREGLPLATRDGGARGGAEAGRLPPHLDPDAATRAGKRWAEADRQQQGRVSGRLWRLVRAGRLGQARALCRQCGQPWRAASLGGGLGPGPVSLGAAAIEDDCGPEGPAAEALGEETDVGGGAARALWRWACFQAAEQAADEDPAEAAILGALGGNLARVLPLCNTWHDRLWAHARSWLEAAIDAAFPPSEAAAEECKAAAAAVVAAAEGNARPQLAAESAGLLAGPWPFEGIAAQAPASWADLNAAVGGEALAGEGSLGFGAAQAALQWGLVRAAVEGDTAVLLLDILPACLQQEPPSGEAQRLPDAKMARIAGHLALALADAGLLPPLHTAASAPPHAREQLEAAAQLLSGYCSHLLACRQYALIPALASRLPAPARRAACCRLLLQLTLEREGGLQQEAYLQLAGWLGDATRDVAPDELTIVLQEVADTSRSDLATGPMLRAMAAGWLWLGPTTVLPAAQHTNALLREFALGGPAAAAAAAALLGSLPAEVQRMLQAPAQECGEPGWAAGPAAAARLGSGQAQALREELLQLRAWWQHFSLDRACAEWQAAAEACADSAEAAALAEEGAELLQAHLGFLGGETPEGGARQPPPLELVCAGPGAGFDRVSEPLTLWAGAGEGAGGEDANPTLTLEAAQQLAGSLQQQLAPLREPGLFELQVSVAEGTGPLHVLELQASGKTREGMARATTLVGLALKGALPGAESPLQVINMDGDAAAMGQLCRAVAYPSAALNAARIRLTLAQLGADAAAAGAELLGLVAGSDSDSDFRGLSPHFAPPDLAMLLDAERLAAVEGLLRAQGC